MANEAHVTIKNGLTEGDVKANWNGNVYEHIEPGMEQEILVFKLGHYLYVTPPAGKPVKFTATIDLDLTYLAMTSTWLIEIRPNSIPDEGPTTVNVTVGDENP
jgi:hypothetical protein